MAGAARDGSLAVLRQLPVACVLLTPDVVVVDATDAFCRLTGRRHDELLTRGLFDVFPPPPSALDEHGANALAQCFERVLASGTAEVVPVLRYDVVDAASGEEVQRWWSCSVVPVLDEQGRIAMLANRVEDVTAYVEAGQEGTEDRDFASPEGASALNVLTRAAELQQALRVKDVLAQRLASLSAVAADLTAAQTVEDLEAVIVHRGLSVLGADGGAIISPHEEGGWRATLASLGEQVVVGYGHVPYDSPLPAPAVARTGEAVLLPTIASGLAFDDSMRDVYVDTGRHGWAFLPLVVDRRCIGSLAVAWREEHPIAPDELMLLRGFAAQCAQALERIRVTEEQRRSAQVALRMSETLQRSLLTQPAAPAHLEIAVRYLAAAQEVQVGGDWYDAFVTADGAALLVVGDVTGHDGAAAAAMGQLRNLLRGLAYDTSHGPATVLGRLDTALHGLGLESLATAVLARIEPAQDDSARVVSWSNAGHLPPLVRRADGRIDVLDTEPDLLLGLEAGTPRTEHRTTLGAGDTVVLYTDGLVERRRAHLDEGINGLVEVLRAQGGQDPEALSDALLRTVGAGSNEDDIALLVLRAGAPVDQAVPPVQPLLCLTLACHASSVGTARRELRRALRAQHDSAVDVEDDVVLLLSELVSNAVMHARSDVRVDVVTAGDRVHVEVFDDDSRPPLRQVHDTGALGGRGLSLLDALAHGWGVRQHGQGKCVWFDVLLPG